MELLPVEIVNEILLLVDRPYLYHVSQVCVQWQQMVLKQVVIIESRDTFVTACHRGDFLSIVKSKLNKLWLNEGLYSACRGGYKGLVELMMSRGADDWDTSLLTACMGGHKELVDLMILKGADDWNGGLYHACESGHKDLVELMMLKGADDWNWGLYHACCGGHKEIVELMITKGADDWNWGLRSACRGGHKEIIQLMILKGANDCNCLKSISEH